MLVFQRQVPVKVLTTDVRSLNVGIIFFKTWGPPVVFHSEFFAIAFGTCLDVPYSI